MSENATKEIDLYGVDLTHSNLAAGYKTHSDYDGQGDKRVVKAIMMPVHVRVASPMFPGVEVFQERLLQRGQEITVPELGLIALEKGERLGAFFTTAELKAGGINLLPNEPVKVNSADLETGVSVSELGPHELVLWLSGDGDGVTAPTVSDVLELVGDDKDFAKRVIDAENTREPNDPRKTLLGPLTKLVESE